MQTKVIAGQKEFVDKRLDALMGYYLNKQYDLFAQKYEDLEWQCRRMNINVHFWDFYEIKKTSELLADFSENNYSIDNSGDSVLFFEESNPKYELHKYVGNLLRIDKYKDDIPKFFTYLNSPQETNITNQALINHLEKILSQNLEKLIDHSHEVFKTQLEQLQKEKEARELELAKLRKQYSNPFQKIIKFAEALLLLPVRFFVSEKYVREHQIFHFTFPQI